ncbi:hypothetical protein RRF57_008081 [Xylaria bambusicola]|uniref:Uncharacterized protein n=1 Tax=Xylaria bambusicola TaxID=326684 RepID=A0AAN7UNR9_9PEZI
MPIPTRSRLIKEQNVKVGKPLASVIHGNNRFYYPNLDIAIDRSSLANIEWHFEFREGKV